MDFSILYRLRVKKIWWVDVIFYSAIALLIASVFCYLIFMLKIQLQKQQLADLDKKMQEMGTTSQQDQEKTVFEYQQKIGDYSKLVSVHGMSSNIFSFIEKNTLPEVWFYKFGMASRTDGTIDLSGEAENMDVVSRQEIIFEKNELVKKVDVITTNVSNEGKIDFSLSLVLDPKIFEYANQ